MRAETRQDIIATWFVVDSVEDSSRFPQSGHNSSLQTFQDVYWRCIACFYATARRQAPGARYVFYTNADHLPVVDGLALAAFLDRMGVEIRHLPIRHRLGKRKVTSWNNQFYILDIIGDLIGRHDYETVMILDSDCVWVRAISSLLSDLDRRGILTLSIPYTVDFINNGASRLDMQKAAVQLTGHDFAFVPHYSGGELFAATRASVAKIWMLAEPMWDRLFQAEPDVIKIYEEGQFLSIIYEILDVPTGTADPHCRRMWTALRLYTVTAEDIFSSRCLWHLPMEKKTGFRDLFRAVCEPGSWLWTLPPTALPEQIARAMGIPQRTLKQWFRHLVARAAFHAERPKA